MNRRTFPNEITREIFQWLFLPREFGDLNAKDLDDPSIVTSIQDWIAEGALLQLVCREWRSLTREMLAQKMIILYDGSTIPAYADVERAKHVWWFELPDVPITRTNQARVSHVNPAPHLSSRDTRLGRPPNVPRYPYPFQHLRILRLDLVGSPPYLKRVFSPLEKGGTVIFPVLEHLDLQIVQRGLDFLLPWSTPALRVVRLKIRAPSDALFWFLREAHIDPLCIFLTRHATGLDKIQVVGAYAYALLGYLAPSRTETTYELTFCNLWAFHGGLAARHGVDKDAVWQGHVVLNLESLEWASMGALAYMGPKTTTLLVRCLEPWGRLRVYLGRRNSLSEGGNDIVRGLSEQCFIAIDSDGVQFCRDVANAVLP